MSPEDNQKVRDLFREVSTTGQLDMRKRACDVIKAYMNDPANKACRETLERALSEVGYLAVDVTA